MAKNIVICCDGTGNQINDQLSNVLKLYRILQKTDDQLVYYNPGVGTVGDYDSWQLVKLRVREFLGLAMASMTMCSMLIASSAPIIRTAMRSRSSASAVALIPSACSRRSSMSSVY